MKKIPKKRMLEMLAYSMRNSLRGEYVYPFYVSFKLLHRCDRRCKFCNVPSEKAREMNTQEVFKVLDEFAKSSLFLVSFEGGEPLLRQDILEILKYAHRQPYYLLFTTSAGQFRRHDMREYCKYIDFLHISIDEEHNNLEHLEKLKEYVGWGSTVCVQIVVRRQDLDALEYKIKKCHEAGAKAVIMPACHLPNTDDMLPDIRKFADICLELKKKYPNTIITTDRYLKTIEKPKCSTSSIIVDCDGSVFYPCRTLETRASNILEEPLNKFLTSEKAAGLRKRMKECKLQCHWYQYFATDSFLHPTEMFSAAKPYLKNFFFRKEECAACKVK